jgi:DNA-binding NtrC family response regulator
MSVSLECILLVTSGPVISVYIFRQSLMRLGYQVFHVEKSSGAHRVAIQNNPDFIIADLNLPELSEKDLLAALSSQGIETPLIVLGNEGIESDIIQAFRREDSDYLCWSAREVKVLSAIERVLKQVRAWREKESLTDELDKTNRKLQEGVRELKTILAIGKTATSTKRQNILFEKIVEGLFDGCSRLYRNARRLSIVGAEETDRRASDFSTQIGRHRRNFRELRP